MTRRSILAAAVAAAASVIGRPFKRHPAQFAAPVHSVNTLPFHGAGQVESISFMDVKVPVSANGYDVWFTITPRVTART